METMKKVYWEEWESEALPYTINFIATTPMSIVATAAIATLEKQNITTQLIILIITTQGLKSLYNYYDCHLISFPKCDSYI